MRRAAAYPCGMPGCTATPETKAKWRKHLLTHKRALLKLLAGKKKKTPKGV